MPSSDGTVNTPLAGTSSERLAGRVKWFNNRAGFGFVTVMEGEKKDEDVFVHHSGIVVNSEQYKYLVQGEYVSFALRESDNDEHPYQAGDVRGILGGWLMCVRPEIQIVLPELKMMERERKENVLAVHKDVVTDV